MLLKYHHLSIPLGKLIRIQTSYHYCALFGTFDLVDVKPRMIRFSEIDLTFPIWINLNDILHVDFLP